MAGLSIIEGRLSEKYNHFLEYYFVSCQATDTRLMGVIALKVTWRSRERSKDTYYQVIHLDYSEYGVDEYFEFDCTVGGPQYQQNKEDMNYYWEHFKSVMGGVVVNIPPDVLLRLIEDALPLARDDVDREYDNEENREFRHYALLRLSLMKEALAGEGITDLSCSSEDAISRVIPAKLATCETINYFLMRIIDHDFTAASSISTMSIEDMKACPLTEPGIQTLMKSSIRRSSQTADPPADGISHPYRCTITTLGRKGYYHSTLVIWLDGSYRSRDPKVTAIEVGSSIRLSEFESAIQVVRKEYLTVFQCPDSMLDGFDGRLIAPFQDVQPTIVPNGWLYTIYKKDNSHVNRTEYRLGDDVYGSGLLTIGGEFILMSNDVNNITMMDNAVLYSYYSPHMKIKGRYLLEKTPVFHTLCNNTGVYFDEIIEPKNE